MKINPITITEAWIAENDPNRVRYLVKTTDYAGEFITPKTSNLGHMLEIQIKRAKAMERALKIAQESVGEPADEVAEEAYANARKAGRSIPTVDDWGKARRRPSVRGYPGFDGGIVVPAVEQGPPGSNPDDFEFTPTENPEWD